MNLEPRSPGTICDTRFLPCYYHAAWTDADEWQWLCEAVEFVVEPYRTVPIVFSDIPDAEFRTPNQIFTRRNGYIVEGSKS